MARQCRTCGSPIERKSAKAVYCSQRCCDRWNYGVLRGILCRNCNAALGLFGDNVEVLMSAAAYLLSGQDVLAKPTKVTS